MLDRIISEIERLKCYSYVTDFYSLKRSEVLAIIRKHQQEASDNCDFCHVEDCPIKTCPVYAEREQAEPKLLDLDPKRLLNLEKLEGNPAA